MAKKQQKSKQSNQDIQNKSTKKIKSDLNSSRYTQKDFLQIAIMALSIVVVGFIMYSRTINYDLVYCDDNIFVNDYYTFNMNPDNASTCFQKTMGTTYYRPMLNLSILYDTQQTLKSQFAGKDPAQVDPLQIKPDVFHRTNLILHLLASMLTFLFLLKMGYNRITSFLFGMLMAVHPIVTPAVAWISGRNDSMITVFILLTLIFFILFKETKKTWMWLYYLAHLFFFGIALFTKEVTAFLPFVCMAYIFLVIKEKQVFTSKNFALIGGWFATGLYWYVMRGDALKGINNPDTIGADALKDTYLSIFALLGKMFLPVKMIALSSYEIFSIVSGIVIMIILAIYLIRSKRVDKERALFGFIWFGLFLFPTLLIRIIFVGDFFDYAEHRAYLVMIGIFILIMEILRSRKIEFNKPITIGIASVLLLAFAARAYSYTPVFKDREAFWGHMVKVYPEKPRGYLDYGKAFFVKDSLAKAEQLYLKGVELNPNNKNLYIDLAAVNMRKGDFAKAETYSRKALSIDPSDVIAYYNLGKSSYSQGNLAVAIPAFEKSVSQGNKYPMWWVDLGIAYYRAGDMDKAIGAYQQCLNLMPRNFYAYSNMGSAYATKGDMNNAIICWNNSLAINPRMYDAYNNLMRYNLYMKDFAKVKSLLDQMIQNGGADKLPPDVKQGLQSAGIKF
jgi:tetratricopeptide (TPR) repeat protein